MTEPAGGAPASGSRSLWADARRRLFKNRLAVASLFWLAFTSAVATLAPWIVPYDPQHQEWWIGKQGPLFSHSILELNMTFEKSKPPPDPFGAARSRVELSYNEGTGRMLRVTVEADGTVREISLGADIDAGLDQDSPETLAVRSPVRFKVSSGAPSPSVTDVELRRGKPLPDAFGPAATGEERVVVGELRSGEKANAVVATVVAGAVASLAKNGAEVPELELHADEVTSVTLDGAPFVHTHLLGTDDAGRDILTRVAFGGRISLMVGIVATVVSLVIGVAYGALSGYAGGRTDEVMMRAVDILYAIPFMFFVIILLVLFERSLLLLFVAIGAVEWLTMARIVRGQVLSLKEKEYVEAARVSGTSALGIVFGHLVPNCLGAVIVYTTLTIPEVILTEAFLSFLGLSVQYNGQSLESWGSLTENGTHLALGGFPWLLVWSALALSTTLFALNFLGDGLRDALDPRLRGRG